MSANVLFISEVKLKALTAVHENLEPQDLMPFVLQSQDIYIQQLLGTNLYDHLKTAVSGSTTTAKERELIDDYVSPTLANYAIYLALPHLNYRIKNKAVLNPTSEESNSTTLEEIKYLRNAVLDTAEFYAERTKSYLLDNANSYFPTYNNWTGRQLPPDKSVQYSAGIYIPKERCINCDNLPKTDY
jgi:hypothetical protein